LAILGPDGADARIRASTSGEKRSCLSVKNTHPSLPCPERDHGYLVKVSYFFNTLIGFA